MTRLGLPLTLVLTALALSACLDDPAVRERLGVDVNGSPLPGASPSPVSPAPSASASASGEASPSPSPSPSGSPVVPGVTGDYQRTFDPIDVAIAGPGYFAVATRPDPESMNDVYFTRLGNFFLDFIPTTSPAPGSAPAVNNGTWTLKSEEGLTVLGFVYQGQDGAPAPQEAASTYYQGAFTLGGGSAGLVKAGPIMVNATDNLNFLPTFNFKGQLLSQNKPPVDVDGNPWQMYLAVAQFEHPEKLEVRSGFNGYRWTQDAGNIQVGIAGVVSPKAGVPRPVGDANIIRPATLEIERP